MTEIGRGIVPSRLPDPGSVGWLDLPSYRGHIPSVSVEGLTAGAKGRSRPRARFSTAPHIARACLIRSRTPREADDTPVHSGRRCYPVALLLCATKPSSELDDLCLGLDRLTGLLLASVRLDRLDPLVQAVGWDADPGGDLGDRAPSFGDRASTVLLWLQLQMAGVDALHLLPQSLARYGGRRRPGLSHAAGYLIAPANARGRLGTLAATVSRLRRELVADNGNFATIGQIRREFLGEARALADEVGRVENALGRSVRRGELPSVLVARFDRLDRDVRAKARARVLDDEAMLASQRPLAPDRLVGAEDITMACWLSLDIERRFTSRPRRRLPPLQPLGGTASSPRP